MNVSSSLDNMRIISHRVFTFLESLIGCIEAIQVSYIVNVFFWKFDTHPLPRNVTLILVDFSWEVIVFSWEKSPECNTCPYLMEHNKYYGLHCIPTFRVIMRHRIMWCHILLSLADIWWTLISWAGVEYWKNEVQKPDGWCRQLLKFFVIFIWLMFKLCPEKAGILSDNPWLCENTLLHSDV